MLPCFLDEIQLNLSPLSTSLNSTASLLANKHQKGPLHFVKDNKYTVLWNNKIPCDLAGDS